MKGRKKKVVEDKTDKLVQTDYFKANNRDTADRAFQTTWDLPSTLEEEAVTAWPVFQNRSITDFWLLYL